MASNKIIKPDLKEFRNKEEYLNSCDVCNSNNIRETREGYVCGDCGVVLEIQKLEYHRPYDKDIIQNAVLGQTQMGFKRERRNSCNSVRLENLNKLDSIRTNEKNVLIKAKIEIKRILNCLNFPDTDKDLILKKFKAIRLKLTPGTKYRSSEKLVPIVIYFYFKLNNKSISEQELLEVSKISKRDFNAFKLQIINFIPEYVERNRKEYILQKVLEISEHFGLGMVFYYQSKKILYKFWDSIKNTKDDVIAGLVTSISALCLEDTNVKVCSICQRLGIRMSTIHRQVEKNVFERLNISGFKSLVKSSDLLKKIMIKMGLIDSPVNEEEEQVDIVEIKLGTAENVFNSHDIFNYYLYAFKDVKNNPSIFSMKFNNPIKLNLFEKSGIERIDKFSEDHIFDLEFWKYHYPRGPPLIFS